MARCYSGQMVQRHALPDIWLVTDERNDARLEETLRRLPRGSGMIFRHHHLGLAARRARFDKLARIAMARGLVVVLAGSAREARRWGASGAIAPREGRISRESCLRRDVRCASSPPILFAKLPWRSAMRADAILLSPVFPTRSHPGASTLGPVRFRLMARHSRLPVIALGGINRHRARSLRWKKWAAIDGI